MKNKFFLLGVGCPRGGTTWLHRYLSSNPAVDMGFTKEYHFFDTIETINFKLNSNKISLNNKFTHQFKRIDFQNDINNYFDYFNYLHNRGDSVTVVGDITPSYCYLSKSTFEIIRKQAESNGFEVKVIFILRDPFERICSQIRLERQDRLKKNTQIQNRSEIILHNSEENELLLFYKTKRVDLRTRYEDTISNIESVFKSNNIHYEFYEKLFVGDSIRKLVNFLKIPYLEPKLDIKIISSPQNSKKSINLNIIQEIVKYYKKTYLFCMNKFGSDVINSIWSSSKYVYSFNEPKHFKPVLNLSMLNQKAEIEVKAGNIQKGKQILLNIIKEYPNNANALNNLGVLEYYEGNFHAAKEFFKNALIANPSYKSSVYNLNCMDKSCFHQNTEDKNEHLLKWVLSDNCSDFRIPTSSIARQNSSIETKSIQNFSHFDKPNCDCVIENQLIDFSNSSQKKRQSYYDKTKKPLSNIEYFFALKDKLIAYGVNVNEVCIDICDFETWLTHFSEIKNFYYKSGDAFIEKCLEHYLVFKYLKINSHDRYIDIAAAGSPWADILNKKGIRSYRLDLSYPKGVHGINIGANAENTSLPNKSFTALSLQCAYECFMGDSDVQFLKEASRILNENGRYAIVPLYLSGQYYISTSPYCDQRKVVIDNGAKKIWREDKYKVPFSRHYSPEYFIKRVYSNIPDDMSSQILFFTNLDELMKHYNKQRIYCFFMLLAEKK